jgi:citronellyl-CoA synthetase
VEDQSGLNLTTNEANYLERLIKVAEERIEDLKLSFGIIIEQHAEKNPNNNALLYRDSSWSWQTLNQESNKIANYFLKIGLKAGDIIAVMMENSLEFFSIIIGINKIQGISSLINVNQRKRALIHSLKISEPSWIVIDGDCLPAFNEVFSDLNFEGNKVFVINNHHFYDHDFIDFQKELIDGLIDNPVTTFRSNLSDISVYLFTSGTTGLPKAALQSNKRVINPFGWVTLELTHKDVVYSPLPLYHSLALVTGWASSIQGGSEYIGSSTLKKMLGVGLRKDIWEEFKSRFHIEHIIEFYGATEGAAGLINLEEIPGMIGRRGILGTIIVVKVNEETGKFYRNERGFLIECNPGETGMMLAKVRENSSFLGYKDKKKTNERIVRNAIEEGDVYFNTGDLVHVHDDKWVSFADRYGDTFRWKGENVSTMEVESILNTFGGFEMCNVYGVEIPYTDGKAGMVSIKLDNQKSFDTDLFSQFVVKNLPKYAIPLFIRIKDELEFTGTHKLRKVNLKKEGFNINAIKDQLYFWDSSKRKYRLLNKDEYENILVGNIKF